MSRSHDRRAKGSWQRQNLGRGGYLPSERIAAVKVVCAKCGELLAIFQRHLDSDDEMGYDDTVGVMYEAGSADDPMARLALACIPCDTPDHLVSRAKMEQRTADLLALCKSDDTPRSETFEA